MKDLFGGLMLVLLSIAIIVGLWFGGLHLYGYTLNVRRQAVQQSQQYVESKQSLLMQLVSEYNTTEKEGQKAHIVNRIKLEADRIPADQIPSAVQTLLRRYR